MQEYANLAKTLITTDSDRLKVDQNVKKILAYKPLLARIFKETVAECKDLTYEEIIDCIEGEVRISMDYVEGGASNSLDTITGQNLEDYENKEGLIKYDIRTYLRIPSGGEYEYLKILIDVEAQNEDKPGYDIPLRALFYCCRMVSSQLGIEFSTDADDPVKYGNIKKVYSIWICTETAQKRANSIESYEIKRDFLLGYNDDLPRYDILNAMIVNISEKRDTGGSDDNLINILTTLFDETLNAKEKIKRLEQDYDLPLTREAEKEVDKMCNYGESREIKGITKGINIGLDKGLKALVNTLKKHIEDFNELYLEVISNEDYADVTEEQVRQYY